MSLSCSLLSLSIGTTSRLLETFEVKNNGLNFIPYSALVLAPNILRTTSDSLVTVFTNSTFESKFTLQLLQNVRPDQVDRDYVPVHGQPLERESMETMTSRGGF